MTGEITRASAPPDNSVQPVHTGPVDMRGEWSAFFAFLKRPALPAARPGAAFGLLGTLRLLALDLLIMAAFIGILMAIVASGFELPDNINASLDMNLETVLLVVVLAPLLEELAFRSWLSGRPRYLAVLVVVIITGIVAAMAGVANTGNTADVAVALTFLGGAVLALLALALCWRMETPGWFTKMFPVLFWLSSTAFALVHLMNYTEGALLLLLPLVVPQLVIGTIAAYVRVHYGLVFAILLHALHNGFALSMAAMGMAAEGGA